MTTYVFEDLAPGAQIEFDPAIDILEFQTAGVNAGHLLIRMQSGDPGVRVHTDNGPLEGKSVFLLNIDPRALTQYNFTFGGGGLVLIGDDSIGTSGDAGNNALTGTAAGDYLMGLEGNDTMLGGDGDDMFSLVMGTEGSYGSDSIDGGAGFDWLFFGFGLGMPTVPLNINLGTGEVSGLHPGDSATALNIEGVIASSLNDSIVGGTTGNELDGGPGNDTLRGEGGNDTLFGYSGNDSLVGGTGRDTALYDEDPNGIVVDLQAGTASDGFGGTDTLSGIEDVIGSENEDEIYGNAFANKLTSNGGGDLLEGRAGNDTLVGSTYFDAAAYRESPGSVVVNLSGTAIEATVEAGPITVQPNRAYDGYGGTDILQIKGADGSAFDDTMVGGAGSQYFAGGAGNDSLAGGTGNDGISFVNSPGGVVVNLLSGTFQDGWGTNDVASSFENVHGSDHHGDSITGNTVNNLLEGYGGNDTLAGGGNTDTLNGGDGDDSLVGGDGNDSLDGGAGNDTLEAGAGDDDLYGGEGDDTYLLGPDDFSGTVHELADQGNDTVITVIASLPGNVENMLYHGAGGTGMSLNDLDNFIQVNAPNMTVGALGGVDTVSYSFLTSAVTIDLELTNADNAQIGHHEISGFENATGGSGDDSLIGSGESNALDGGPGADDMQGGGGNDVYYIDDASDTVTEETNTPPPDASVLDGFIDSVVAAIDFSLENVQFVENVELEEEAAALTATGNELDNHLEGNAFDNTIAGLAGNDTLDGGPGTDTMAGGVGDDFYIVDVGSFDDTLTENSGEGRDTVVIWGPHDDDGPLSMPDSANYTLGANLENLFLYFWDSHQPNDAQWNLHGTGNTLSNQIVGNGAANNLVGLAGNDTLDGAGGNDSLDGGNGHDTYFVDSAGDGITETSSANSGTDTVRSTITYTLGLNLEKLVLLGTDLINGTGNGANNTITGNNVRNTLSGGNGNDTLNGALGNDSLIGGNGNDSLIGGGGNDTLRPGTGLDTLSGGTGNDNFMFAENPGENNIILDFASGADKIRLDDVFHVNIGPLGAFAADDGRFHQLADVGTGKEADDRVIYESSTGILWYDSDGSGGSPHMFIATLDGIPTLLASDIVVF
jgi:Ca2+-binding RTX toxin-like protein